MQVSFLFSLSSDRKVQTCWLWEKESGFPDQVPDETSPHLLLGLVRPTTGCGTRLTSLWVYRNLFWQLSRDENSQGSGMPYATTASPKSSFKSARRMGDAVVDRGNAGWTTSKNGHPCPCQSCSQGPPAEKNGRGSLLNRPSCPPDESIGQGTEVNWTVKVNVLLTHNSDGFRSGCYTVYSQLTGIYSFDEMLAHFCVQFVARRRGQ